MTTPIITGNIRAAVTALSNNVPTAAEYGPIATWDTSKVTNMDLVFCGNSQDGCQADMEFFSQNFPNLSEWDTSMVSSMIRRTYLAGYRGEERPSSPSNPEFASL
jgi:hypothetical protein